MLFHEHVRVGDEFAEGGVIHVRDVDHAAQRAQALAELL